MGKEDVEHPLTKQAHRRRPFGRASACAVALLLAAAAPARAVDELPAGAAPETLALGERCLAEAARQEQAMEIPAGLLTAIALAESGRWDRQAEALRAWPWTLNVAGDGLYFDTRAEARAAAAAALAAGERQVDIGCMQVSMAWHANGFETVTEALEPVNNVAYGARYLRELYDQHGDWSEAVRRYHSGDAARGEAYLRRVIALWQGEGSVDGAALDRLVAADRRDSPHHQAADRLRDGDFDGARDLYDRILRRNPDDRTALAGMALAEESAGRTIEALDAWRNYLAREPGSIQAANRVTELLRGVPGPEAEVLLADLVTVAPGNAHLLDALARRKLAAGDVAGGTALLIQAARLAPDEPVLLYNAAVMLDRLDRPRAAVEAYEAFLTAQTRRPVVDAESTAGARARLGWLRGRGGRP